MPTQNENKTLNKLFDLDVNTRGNVYINNSVSDTVKKILDTVSDNEVQLKVDKIWVDEKYDNADIGKQQEVRNKGQNWANDLRADLTLVDRITGKPIDQVKGMKVASIPKITDRGTFLIGGNEYQFTKQARLKPGVYTKVQNNGEISSFFNVDKTVDFERGFNNNFRIGFDPEKKLFTMGYGTKNVPLINALRAVGVSDNEMRNKWGTDVFKANDDANSGSELRDQKKLYNAIFGILPPAAMTPEKMKGEIKDRLFKTKLDPDTTRITLGKPYGQVDKDPILDASKKIIDIHKGDVPEDDRESLIFKSFYDVEDHLRERLIKNSAKIKSAMLYKLKKNKLLNKSLSSQSFDPFVLGTLTQSQLSNPPNQTNIMSIIGDGSKMTVMGEGGIGSANAVTTDTRNISNSEVAFIDPLHTPEGSSIGTSVHTSLNTIKVGNDLYAKFLHPSGEKTFQRPIDVYDKVVAFPDQYDISDGKPKAKDKLVRAVHKGQLVQVPSSKVDFVIPSHIDMFDTSVNMIPFLDSIQGNRGLTASKIQEQALPLKDRERPLFSIKTDDGKDLGKILGQSIATPSAKVEGEVVGVDLDKIVIKDKSGKEHVHSLYNNFSLNAESFISSDPTVKVGDKVKADQVLADNNFTKDGHVAIGTNLNVAYMSYKGYNYEDSAIISESAAKKLTSLHLYDLKARRSSDGVFSKSKYQAYYPEEIKSSQAAKLDKDGVVKIGEKVDRGDTLIAHLEKRTPTADDLAIGRLDKQLKRDMLNNAVKWENDHVGVVTGVEKHGNNVLVSVKTEEPLKVADKISGLHGNKHIISKIVPDDQMPYNPATGEKIDLTMSPIGVSNRINTSQLLENAAGKIARKTGKPFEIQNFRDVDNSRMIMDELKKNGLSDKDILVDPESGKPFLNPVANGVSHILKLEHKVDHKFSARYNEGHDSNQQAISGGETGGKNMGRMEVSALLARGANVNLKEMFTIKGQRNDEYWRAMETGQSLPPPKNAFVWDKQMAMMNGAGINVEQKGKTFTLKPMTDKDILKISSGEISNPELTYRKKDMAPIKGGLFDPLKAGGMMGDNFTHFKLPEKVLNPVMASAAASLLGVPIKHLDEIMEGKKFIDKTTGEVVTPGSTNAISGGPAAEILLSRVNVKNELAQAQESIHGTTNSTAINKLNTKIRILKALDANDMKPTDYLISHVLVTPSKYRPMFAMGVDKTVIMSDVNDLYQQTANTKNALANLSDQLDKTIKNEDIKNLQMAEIRGTLYKDVKAVAGLGDPTAFLHRTKNKKGYIEQIGGGQEKQTKDGFFQSKVLERRQDLVGRSTIILNPELGGDEMGIPKEMAAKIFQPFVMKKMVGWGYSPLEASKHVKDKSPIFDRALQVVADERLVIANRAPTLHRWNMTAFKPKLTDGKSIEVPSVVVSRNFGGDFDGDSGVTSTVLIINLNKLRKFDNGFEMSYIDGIENFTSHREVFMPSNVKVPVFEGERVVHVNLEDFPRHATSKRVNASGIMSYDVPDGVEIITCDPITLKTIRVPVTEFSIHPNLNGNIVEFNDGNEMTLSDDHSAIALNTETWTLEKIKPSDLKGKAIPKVRKLDLAETVFSVPAEHFSTRTTKSIDNIELTHDIGYLIGILVGNGWADTRGIHLSSIHKAIADEFERIINSIMVEDIDVYKNSCVHDFLGKQVYHEKHSARANDLLTLVSKWIGSGAVNKHLPTFFLSSPSEFRKGLFDGLIDTDGSVSWSHGKDKPQFMMNYSTSSLRLADEFVTLCKSLGISASITPTFSTSSGNRAYIIGVSSTTLYGKKFNLRNRDKVKILSDFLNGPPLENGAAYCHDHVPFSSKLYGCIKRELKLKCRLMSQCEFYHSIHDGVKRGTITRNCAKNILNLNINLPKEWVDIVNNESITWLYVRKMSRVEDVTMYDITAPGPYTFMTACGVIIQDTFQVHTPISSSAIAEAELMKPSSSMIKAGHDGILNTPQMDMTVGAWLVSKGKGGTDTKMSFDTVSAARDAFKASKFHYGDTVSIDGKKAPFGIHEINSTLPEEHQKWDVELNQKNIENWVREVTKSKNGKVALALADKIKDVGNNYVTKYGYTLGVSDTVADQGLKKLLLSGAEKNVDWKNPLSVIKEFASAKSKGEKDLEGSFGENSMLGIGIKSGGSKDIGNVAAISLMPGIVEGADGMPIPMPITRSYSEGLDTFGYWAAAHGARGGNIRKSISSSKPGWFTKDLINSVYETRVAGSNPVDTTGIQYSVNDKKGILNRFLAKDVSDTGGKIIAKRNDVVDSDLVNKLNRSKINSVFVQSPLTDPTPGDGFSSYSYGTDYDGKVLKRGDNIGIISAHTITEPALNLAMKAFHTGGAYSEGKPSGTAFDQLDKLMRFNKNKPDKATLASMDGKISDIRKSSIGGYDVILKDDMGNEERRYVAPMNEPTIKKGDKVSKGDALSTGVPLVHDILKYKGMPETQRFLVDQLDKINGTGKIDKRDLETIVRGVTNTTRIMRPGSSQFVSGDIAPLTTIEYYNNNNEKDDDVEDVGGDHFAKDYGSFKKHQKIDDSAIKKLTDMGIKRVSVFKDRIKHEPFLSPLGIGGKAVVSEDWIARMAHNRLKTVLEEGASQGWKTDITDTSNPITQFVTGVYA